MGEESNKLHGFQRPLTSGVNGFIIPTRRFRPQTRRMLAHANSGHWYVCQAWAKALREIPLSRANCGQPIWRLQGMPLPILRDSESSRSVAASQSQERCTTGKKAVWEGWGVGWGVHPLKDVTLTTTKRRAVSLTGDAPDTRYSKLWAARPRAFDHRGEGMGRVHRWAVASMQSPGLCQPSKKHLQCPFQFS